jgi:hypothetical protein
LYQCNYDHLECSMLIYTTLKLYYVFYFLLTVDQVQKVFHLVLTVDLVFIF